MQLKPSPRRAGDEAWFPYYAGYSPTFVRMALTALGAQPGWRVLDPWNGSGTTTTVANAAGCEALGFDLNPVAALVASARLTRADDTLHAAGLAKEFLIVADRKGKIRPAPQDALRAWLSLRLVRRYRALEAAILELLASREGIAVKLVESAPPPFAAFFLLCLIRAAKQFIQLKTSSNPTWITARQPGDAAAEALDEAFLTLVQESALDAAAVTFCPAKVTVSRIEVGDARSLPIPDNSVEAIIASPPYCTRIDYFRATHFELAALGVSSSSGEFRALRSQAMGTSLLRTEAGGSKEFPEPIRYLLQCIRSHSSKASSTYYYKNFLQYFVDMRQSLSEIRRVLKPGCCAALVVQSSYYKEVPILLGDLYNAMAEQTGLEASIVHREPVRRVLATINSRAAKHESDRRYTEDVVAMHKAH